MVRLTAGLTAVKIIKTLYFAFVVFNLENSALFTYRYLDIMMVWIFPTELGLLSGGSLGRSGLRWEGCLVRPGRPGRGPHN